MPTAQRPHSLEERTARLFIYGKKGDLLQLLHSSSCRRK